MTLNKKISLTLGIIVIVAAAGTAVFQDIQLQSDLSAASATAENPISANTPPAVASTSPASPSTTAAQKTPAAKQAAPAPAASGPASYTLADVAKHSTASSCWTAINGGVYNLTSWIDQHPGGPEAILSICGKDGSAAFNAQHGGQSKPAEELATFKIGVLASS